MSVGETPSPGHPSARRWRADLQGMAERVADQLEAGGLEYSGAAAAARAVRGSTGLDRGAFAREIGSALDAVAAIETGASAVCELPFPLVERGEFLDWRAFEARDALAFLDRIDPAAVVEAASALSSEFATRDVSEHELVWGRHHELVVEPGFHSAVGRVLSEQRATLSLDRLPLAFGDRGAVWLRRAVARSVGRVNAG